MKKLLLTLLLLISCAETPKAKFTLEMTRVDGKIITETYVLPEDAKFGVSAYGGGYYLYYGRFTAVKPAVIDFKILKKETVK